ncbi:CaiB/BaiF CoA transferase family protein [Nocardiopsis mangrovi]|uniref:CaiB/BaiF CoA transferase family protein n=1 Tax=Nocardiopsis mangrovi TaxID=1179818 RepID=A0ABV9DU15_9ACTN
MGEFVEPHPSIMHISHELRMIFSFPCGDAGIDDVFMHVKDKESSGVRPYKPLAGVVVVSLEQAVAGPFASRQLADLGATVFKIERPGAGDLARGYDRTVRGMASHFMWLNRGKYSVELDAKTLAGRELLGELVDTADVVIQNLAPGAMERLGFGSERLRAQRPALITCDISGYGRGGPYGDKKAYDLLIQCEAGLVSITGTSEQPSKVGLSIADICTGMYAYSGVLTALYDRDRTGIGAGLEVSMLEALGEWMGYPLYYTEYGGDQPPRAGASHATIAPYGPFTAADGITLNLGLQNEREWKAFCTTVLQQPELADAPRFAGNTDRVAHRAELDAIIQSVFDSITGAEAAARLDAAPIAWAQQRTIAEFARHPQLRARDRWRTATSPVGDVCALRPPVTVAGFEQETGSIPALGEHNDVVRDWLARRSEPARLDVSRSPHPFTTE